jgi:UDP-N-acetylmuramoyl-L-alanyl-D-glutamate--2,6-diaminopimelate ligase
VWSWCTLKAIVRAEALRERLAVAGQLVDWPERVPEELGPVITDSRNVVKGGVFVAYVGSTSDGHDFLPAAEQAGAACALVERMVAGLSIPQIVIRAGRPAAAAAAALQYGDPAAGLELVGVTGTNGKTTTVHLLRHLLSDRGKAASIGTLGAIVGDDGPLPGTGQLTTPGPVETQALLAALRDAGVRSVAMEVSSHSLDQDRVAGLRFNAAVFTNVTRDHLDYHGDQASYLAAKLKLARYLAPDGRQVVNADDSSWQALPPGPGRLSFAIESQADVRARDIAGDATGMRFTLVSGGGSVPVRLPLLGRYNVENALGAAAAALALGRTLEPVAERLATSSQVPGRMERLADSPCTIIRDYAHTPDAFERALAALRPLTTGRLMIVFGCGGDRDRGKRPLMGRVAARDANLVIITEDNPRTESVEAILDDIAQGIGDVPHLRIVDRRAAIARAISIARPGDTILLAGKGHETYQIVGSEKRHFDEREIVSELTSSRAK